jgi:hypothetical protein
MLTAMRTAQPTRATRLGNLVLRGLPLLTFLGFAGLVANLVLSFEEPQSALLIASGLLLAAAPLGMALHLAATRQLSREEKRRWVAGLLSQRGPALFSAYFTSAERDQITQAMCEAGPARASDGS